MLLSSIIDTHLLQEVSFLEVISAATEVRLALLRNGYLPLVCNGKSPDVMGKGWQNRTDTNEAQVRMWGKTWPYSLNTGCLTKYTPTLDVDITERAASRAVLARLQEQFDGRGVVLCRIGNAPKFAVPFRTSTPFGKFATKVTAPDGGTHQFEFLGDGQQFIVAGVHPDTRQSYRWWPKDRDLTTVPRAALPHIDETGARALVEDLAAMLVCDLGFTRPEEKRATHSSLTLTPGLVCAARAPCGPALTGSSAR